MTDIRLVWDAATGTADLALDGADLATDDGLATAVIISLFTDRRVANDDLPPGERDRRGFWADALNEDPEDETGSWLWLLERVKETPDVLVKAEEYCHEALAWLVEDGVARAVAVTARWLGRGLLGLGIAIDRRDAAPREYQFAYPLAA